MDYKMHELIKRERKLRQEADNFLQNSGLWKKLMRYGTTYLAGSYYLKLMVWRDLDVVITVPELNPDAFLGLGGEIEKMLSPVEIFHMNNCKNPKGAGGPGLYWGVLTGKDFETAWKLDIWVRTTSVQNYDLLPAQSFKNRLDDTTRLIILKIKEQCWQRSDYRRFCWKFWDRDNSFAAPDIYRAVLDEGVRDMETFFQYLKINRR